MGLEIFYLDANGMDFACGAVYPVNKRAVKGTGHTKSEYALSITCRPSAQGRKENRCKAMRVLVNRSNIKIEDFEKLVRGESTGINTCTYNNESVASNDLYHDTLDSLVEKFKDATPEEILGFCCIKYILRLNHLCCSTLTCYVMLCYLCTALFDF